MPNRVPRSLVILAALGALALLGIVFAGVVDRGSDALPPTTVVRTATIAGQPEVRTVTVEAQPVSPPKAGKDTQPVSAPGTGAAGGAALNDEGFRLLRSGNAAAALPLLDRAVAALRGTGSLAEAFASYNLALARFSAGDCTGVRELLHRSEQIQGNRSEIKQLDKDIGKGCRH